MANMSSHCLSNIPIFSQGTTIRNNSHSISSLHPKCLIPVRRKNQSRARIVRAVAGNGRENLDHLQRTGNKIQQQQQQQQPPKRRVAQSSPIGLWDRFPTARTVQQMMDTMERLMDDPLAGSAWASPLPGEGSRGRTPWEIKEGEEEYKVRFDMPGMTREDVKVWVEEKMLVLKAEKVEKKESNGEEKDGEEWSAKSYGKYSFRIALPENIQFEKIKAEVRDGVLYVTIPKAPLASKILDINVQ